MATGKTPSSQPSLPSSWDFVRPSIQLIRQNIDTMLWLIILPGLLSVLGSIMSNRLVTSHTKLLRQNATPAEIGHAFQQIGHDFVYSPQGRAAIILASVFFLWSVLVYPAILAFTLRAARDEPADVFTCLRAGFAKFWRVYGLSLLILIMVCVGLVFFIVPGVILFRRYLLAPYFLMDRDLTIRGALQACKNATEPYKNYIWGTIGVFVLFNLVSSVLNAIPIVGFVIGLIASYIYYFGFVLRYLSIVASTPEKE